MSLTAQQPEINIARTAIEALAGVLGGTQSLHTNSFDEALALPTEKAARIALRTQQIIAHETGVTNVADPLGGSWYVEALTDEMERQAEEIFARLAELGDGSMLEGVYAGIENGYFQSEIADAAYDFERKLNNGARVMVGVNGFTEGNDEAQPDLLEITAEHEMTPDQAAAGGAGRSRRRGRAGVAGHAAGRGGRPRAQPDAGADRRGPHLRHRGRDHGRPGRGVRPLRGASRHLRAGSARSAVAGSLGQPATARTPGDDRPRRQQRRRDQQHHLHRRVQVAVDRQDQAARPGRRRRGARSTTAVRGRAPSTADAREASPRRCRGAGSVSTALPLAMG